jgi:hypothetical protein
MMEKTNIIEPDLDEDDAAGAGESVIETSDANQPDN